MAQYGVVAAALCPCVGLFEVCGVAGIGMPIDLLDQLGLCESVRIRAFFNVLRTFRIDGMGCGLCRHGGRWSIASSAITPPPTEAAEIGRVEEMLL